MGFFDRFRRKSVAPVRIAPTLGKRNYEAARPSRIAGGFTSLGYVRSVNEEIRWDLKGLIAHSRKQAQNNDYLKAYFSLVRRNVVGPHGIRFQNMAINTNGAPDKAANDAIEGAFEEWGRKGNCTLDGETSWRGLQELIVPTVARDGSVLVRVFKGRSYGPFGYQLQVMEIDFLDILTNEMLPNGGSIRLGIEFDADGRRVAYHLFTRHPGEYMPGRALTRIRVPADQMLLIMRPERPGQILGVPWNYTALRRLNMLHGYEEAAITAARVGASQMGFYERLPDADAAGKSELEEGEKSETGALVTDFTPGMIEELPMGVSFKAHDPKYPTGEMKPFMQVALQGAAAGLDVSYVTLANDLSGANFSSLRAGKGEERDEWKCLQQWIIEELHQKVFEQWLPLAFLSGKLGNLPLSKIEKFAQPRWRPRGWAYVNPGDESTANQRDMASMLRSPQEIVAERGAELEEVFNEIKQAKELAKSMGLEFNPMAPGHETAVPMAPGDAADEANGTDTADKPKKPPKGGK
ncbi:phage portal protein [Aestuariivirga litoralis]|uniref:phage portal protein n=1 Tax=Aestuariivirga litoralis TaxID=2650924 RepID=UPI0018C6EF6A|nr:phage portal protein [Aestuariivirga litoralis]MBG1232980.1 phage portal protein [Aestuariivirga litoralis]